jgi:hypothetical protein
LRSLAAEPIVHRRVDGERVMEIITDRELPVVAR